MDTRSGHFIGPWWRIGGVLGIVHVVLFLIGGFALQGESPSRGDSIEEIRQYFTDDGDLYLAGDYVLAIGFVFAFLPFAVILRWMLGSAEGWPPIFSWLTVIGATTATALGAAAGAFWGALALSADNPEVDDSVVRAFMEADAYVFTTLALPIALFIGSASVVMLRTGIFWRWLGALGLLAALLLVIGVSWPIDGDEEGALAIPGFIGFPLWGIWTLVTSVAMIMRKDEPPAIERGSVVYT
jgi:hypothetical protein